MSNDLKWIPIDLFTIEEEAPHITDGRMVMLADWSLPEAPQFTHGRYVPPSEGYPKRHWEDGEGRVFHATHYRERLETL